MTVKWHSVSVQCPKCHDNMVAASIYSSADGEFRFEFKCFRDGGEVSWLVKATDLQHRAMCLDVESYVHEQLIATKKQKHGGPLRPPMKQLNAPTFVQEDLDALKAMGILDEESL